MDIEIGKFTLESLTTGMYSEPEVCFREYIQNSVDSFDEAIAKNILSEEDCRIEVIVNENSREITIKDNGVGINKELAKKTLLDIGNSNKSHTANRGFRGIGRLGGLSYCKKLSFCTSSQKETEKTIVSFDCIRLKELLVPGKNKEYNLQEVIEQVTEVTYLPEQSSAHYFIVKMEGVDDITSLMDLDTVKDYIAQVAPVPFPTRFYWSSQIKETLVKNDIKISEYPVFVGASFESLSQVFKPYKNTNEANSRAGVVKDEINGVSFFEVRNKKDVLLACGWYADTNFSGTLTDERIAGIRIRQGNILIGGSRTLSSCFKEARFNGWAFGEVYAVSEELIPNARRDDYEKNATFIEFENGIKNTVGSEISDKIRFASKARNNPIQKVIKKAEETIKKTEDILTSGFNSSYEKGQLAEDIASMRKELYIIPKNSPTEIIEQKTAIVEKLSSLEDEVNESTKFVAKKDVTANFSKEERKIIKAIMEVLTRNFERATVNSLYKEFIEELKKGNKN